MTSHSGALKHLEVVISKSEYLGSYGTESGSGLSFRRPGPGAGQPHLPAEGSALRGGIGSTGRREIPHALRGSCRQELSKLSGRCQLVFLRAASSRVKRCLPP